MVFKLTGDKHKDAPGLPGATLFDPSGKKRPVKEWVQLSFAHSSEWTIPAQAVMKYAGGKN